MYSMSRRNEALRLLAEGHTLPQASRLTGISRAAIRHWAAHPGSARGGSSCPRCDFVDLDAEAYSALLGFYLGDGCISRAPRYFALRVSCDLKYPASCRSTARDASTRDGQSCTAGNVTS